MKSLEKKKIIDLLNRCWMTHDGMWFFHSLQEVGVEVTNRINKAAIRSLAPLEIKRMKAFFGMEEERIETFLDFKDFFSRASQLFIPDFMNVSMSFPRENVMHWEFAGKECFAFKGMKRIGVIDQYECGVIYRIECWIESLGIEFDVRPKVTKCALIENPSCCGDFTLHF
jgi:hypothetical protein